MGARRRRRAVPDAMASVLKPETFVPRDLVWGRSPEVRPGEGPVRPCVTVCGGRRVPLPPAVLPPRLLRQCGVSGLRRLLRRRLPTFQALAACGRNNDPVPPGRM